MSGLFSIGLNVPLFKPICLCIWIKEVIYVSQEEFLQLLQASMD